MKRSTTRRDSSAAEVQKEAETARRWRYRLNKRKFARTLIITLLAIGVATLILVSLPGEPSISTLAAEEKPEASALAAETDVSLVTMPSDPQLCSAPVVEDTLQATEPATTDIQSPSPPVSGSDRR